MKCWSEDSTSTLQPSFECMDWDCFFDASKDINELCESVSSYITFSVDSTVPSKKVVIYPNNKPWVTKELKSTINKKKVIYCTGDQFEKKEVSREVKGESVEARWITFCLPKSEHGSTHALKSILGCLLLVPGA